MHRFVKLAAMAVAVMVALTGCSAVDWFVGVEPVEVPRMEQAVDKETGKPLFDEKGAPILRPVVGADGKPVVDVEYRQVKNAPISYAQAVLRAALGDNWGGPAAGILGALAAGWFALRKRGADQKVVATYDKFKAVVAGITSLVDGKDGDTFSVQELYAAVSGAAELYTDNADEFAKLVATIKAELRAAKAAKES